MCSLTYSVSLFILFNKFYVCVNFCYKLIFINKFIKHSGINELYCAIKYLGLYSYFNFVIINNFLFIYINNY